jgi:hypothetical protein
MKEKSTGQEALRYLPLSDVFFDVDNAMEVLSPKTQSGHDKVMQLIKNQYIEAGQSTANIDLAWQRNIEGGFCLTRNELNAVLNYNGQRTFESFMSGMVKEGIPEFYKNPRKSRDPGVLSMGYLLDFINCVNPDIASYNDRVAIVSEVYNQVNPLNFVLLGAMVDDAKNLASKSDFPDLFMDPEEVTKFEETLLSQIGGLQELLFKRGRDISYNELIQIVTGFSAN